MSVKHSESVAAFLALGGLLAFVLVPLSYERCRLEGDTGEVVIVLTGVASQGIWTSDDVTAMNFWAEGFRPAKPTVRVGDHVVLKLRSADVSHSFYLPELGLGPAEVEPGHEVILRFVAEKSGIFDYYCVAVCGHCHYFMRGRLKVIPADGEEVESEVQGDESIAEARPRADLSSCPMHAPAVVPETSALAMRGAKIFGSFGCVACHGPSGVGGHRNYNAATDLVPTLSIEAERMALYEPEHLTAVLGALEAGRSLEGMGSDPPFEDYDAFLEQYVRIKKVILDGVRAQKKDPAGPKPPLDMPSWKDKLTERDAEALIAYILTLYDWDEDN